MVGHADASIEIADAKTGESYTVRKSSVDSGQINGIVVIDQRYGSPLTFASSDRLAVYLHQVRDLVRGDVSSFRMDIGTSADWQWSWKRHRPGDFSSLALGHNPRTGGHALFVGMGDGTVALHDVDQNKTLMANSNLHRKPVISLIVGLDPTRGSQVVVSLGADGDVKFWDPLYEIRSLSFVSLNCRVAGITALSHPKTGKMVIATVSDRRLDLWDGESLLRLQHLVFEKSLTAVAAIRSWHYPSIVVGDQFGILRRFELR